MKISDLQDHPQFNNFIRAFWRRIEPYKMDYVGKEPPTPLPVEFRANMATALCVFPDDLLNDPNGYQELLMAVERRFLGESRHETALRYIRQCEEGSSGPVQEVKG